MHLKHTFRLLCAFPLFIFASEKPVKVFILAGDELVPEQGLIEGRTDGVFDAFYPNAQKTAGEEMKHVNCAVMGHPFVAVMSKGNSIERARMMRAFGAEVVLVDQLPGSLPGQVIRCYVVEPAGAATQAGLPVVNPNHRIQGGGYAMKELPLLRRDLIDDHVQVTDGQAIEMARRLAKEEGIFAGFSSGANVAAAIHLLETTHPGKTIAVLLCDSGMKYLSTDLWPP